MKLNNYSYAHVRVRKLCQLLEYHTNMKLLTNLSEEFQMLRFINELSYITIDYKHSTICVMSHKITAKEMDIIDEIQVTLGFMETVGNWQAKHK